MSDPCATHRPQTHGATIPRSVRYLVKHVVPSAPTALAPGTTVVASTDSRTPGSLGVVSRAPVRERPVGPLRAGLLQRRSTSLRDTPKSCQSSQAFLVNLRCISTALAGTPAPSPYRFVYFRVSYTELCVRWCQWSRARTHPAHCRSTWPVAAASAANHFNHVHVTVS